MASKSTHAKARRSALCILLTAPFSLFSASTIDLETEPLSFEQHTPLEKISAKLFTRGRQEISKRVKVRELRYLLEARDLETRVGQHWLTGVVNPDTINAIHFRLPYLVVGVNECTHAIHRHKCHASTKCRDTEQSYECDCQSGQVALATDDYANCAGANSTEACCGGAEACKASFRCAPDKSSLEMQLNGEKHVVLTQGDRFEDPMVSVTDKRTGRPARNFTVDITFEDDRLNSETLDEVGTYTIRYSVDTAPKSEMTRTIEVRDINECEVDASHPWHARCHKWARCENTNGAYKCLCNEGTHGDGWDGTGTRLPENVNVREGARHGCWDDVPPVIEVAKSKKPRKESYTCIDLLGRPLPGVKRDYAAEVKEVMKAGKPDLRTAGLYRAYDILNGKRIDLTSSVVLGEPRTDPTSSHVVLVPLSVKDGAGNEASALLQVKIDEKSPSQAAVDRSSGQSEHMISEDECEHRVAEARRQAQQETDARITAYYHDVVEDLRRQVREKDDLLVAAKVDRPVAAARAAPRGPEATTPSHETSGRTKTDSQPDVQEDQNDATIGKATSPTAQQLTGSLIALAITALLFGVLICGPRGTMVRAGGGVVRGQQAEPAFVYRESPNPVGSRQTRPGIDPVSPVKPLRAPVANRSPFFSPGP